MTPSVRNDPDAWDERADAPTSHEAALWSEAGQNLRHAMIAEWLKELVPTGGFGDESVDVLDWGCGTGALALHLDPEVFEWIGYDWSPAMRARARK